MMPVLVDWQDAEQTIITYQFLDSWTVDEFHLAMDKVNKMLHGWSAPRMDTVSDLSRSKVSNFGMQPGMMPAVRRSEKLYPKALAYSYIVGAPRWIDFSLRPLRVLMPFFDTKVRFAQSIEEAVLAIEADREKMKL